MSRGVFNTLGLNRATFKNRFGNILAILFLTILTVTPLLYVKKYMMALWMFFAILMLGKISKANRRLKQVGLLAIAFVLICILYYIVGVSSADLAYCMVEPFVFFSPIVALIVIDSNKNENQIRFLFHFISLVIAINVADSIRISHELGLENLAFQQLAGVMEDVGTHLNLGGSLFVNMVVLYTSVMFFSVIKAKDIFEKALFLIYLCIGSYFIIMCSMKGSAIILLLASLILQFIANRSRGNFGKIIIVSIIFVGIIFAFRDVIINVLIDLIDNERITERLMVFSSSESMSDSHTLMAREDLWRVSLKSWLRDPGSFLFGIGDHNWEAFSSTAASGVGNHSDIVDVLARYGIIGGVILFSSIIIYYKYLMKKYGTIYRWEIFSFFVILILMGFTKKFVAGEPAIVLFLLLPLGLRVFSYEKFSDNMNYNRYNDGVRK